MAKIRLPTEAEIRAFSLQVPIATKDYGVQPIEWWGTQRTLINRILAGKQRGINQFIVVKARQVGASTAMLILTLLWLWRFPGLQGLTVTDGDENKAYFRDLFLMMVEDLAERQGGGSPAMVEAPTEQQRLRTRNQVQITWANQSRLLLQTCSKATWKRLGVGRGLSYLHGTEAGLWHNGMKAMTYLRSAFSEINPAALYVIESTARGKNWYYDLWMSALDGKTMDAIFLAWWMREDNRIKAKSQKKLFAAYDGPLSAKEREWDKLVRKRDKVIITPEQWAWRRWYRMEKAGGSHRLADQEMPTVWEDAYSASQERPFLDHVTQSRLQTLAQEPATPYVYEWGSHLEDTNPVVAPPGTEPMLHVWDPPDLRPAVVAAVPSYAVHPEDPAWVVSVWAASLDSEKLVQVAEFGSDLNIGIQPFAWIALHLAGAYGANHRTFMLEVQGLGMGVLAEVRRLVSLGWGTNRRSELGSFLGGIRHYIYRRPDTLASTPALMWKTSGESQSRLMSQLRDQIQRGLVEPRSPAMIEELTRLEGRGESYDPAGETPRQHRVHAAALALEAYITTVFPLLRRYRAVGVQPVTVPQRTVQAFVASLGRR